MNKSLKDNFFSIFTKIILFHLLVLPLIFGCKPNYKSNKNNSQKKATNTLKNESQNTAKKPKYIIYMFTDGTGLSTVESARMYNKVIKNKKFCITDKIMKHGSFGVTTTHSRSNIVTDSAGAASALSTGYKVNNGVIGMLPDGSKPQNIVEMVQKKGMSFGIASNSQISDASPAAFYSHSPSRHNMESIAMQLYNKKADIIMGGGKKYFLPINIQEGERKDNKNLINMFKESGYEYIDNKNSLLKAKGKKVIGLFNNDNMTYSIDRDKNSIEPSLIEITNKMINLLYTNSPQGFFMFVETEDIDNAGHRNDIAAAIHALSEFDDAVNIAYNFYQKHPDETLLIVGSDHNSGGLSITYGFKDNDLKERDIPTIDLFKKIDNIKISLTKASYLIGENPSKKSISKVMKQYFPDFTIENDLINLLISKKHLNKQFWYSPENILGEMVARNTRIYWGSSGHTTEPVFITAIGPGSERLKGYLDNTDIGKFLKEIISQK